MKLEEFNQHLSGLIAVELQAASDVHKVTMTSITLDSLKSNHRGCLKIKRKEPEAESNQGSLKISSLDAHRQKSNT